MILVEIGTLLIIFYVGSIKICAEALDHFSYIHVVALLAFGHLHIMILFELRLLDVVGLAVLKNLDLFCLDERDNFASSLLFLPVVMIVGELKVEPVQHGVLLGVAIGCGIRGERHCSGEFCL